MKGSQEPCPAWRVVYQHGQELPRGVSQQEQGRELQQEQRLACLLGSLVRKVLYYPNRMLA